mmetsp:Transcript_14593/g.36314  ORF Transcript_14593/g.36314 Transcript_14593/m.36314 type:complete len:201 (+) Transcript_14593:3484-4086(+)
MCSRTRSSNSAMSWLMPSTAVASSSTLSSTSPRLHSSSFAVVLSPRSCVMTATSALGPSDPLSAASERASAASGLGAAPAPPPAASSRCRSSCSCACSPCTVCAAATPCLSCSTARAARAALSARRRAAAAAGSAVEAGRPEACSCSRALATALSMSSAMTALCAASGYRQEASARCTVQPGRPSTRASARGLRSCGSDS